MRYEPHRGELTGLLIASTTPWDQPNTWWLDILATWPIDPPNLLLAGLRWWNEPWPDQRRSRTNGMKLSVRVDDSKADLLMEAARILDGLCVTEAVVCHVSPPMARDVVMQIQEYNAKLVRWYRAVPDVERRLAQVFSGESGDVEDKTFFSVISVSPR